MPRTSQKQQAIRALDKEINRIPENCSASTLRRLRVFLCLKKRHNLASKRYLSRPAYIKSSLNDVHSSQASDMLSLPERSFHQAFRMTPEEMDGLVDLFGQHSIFISTGHKRQAPPKLQLGLLVYRLAHGHDALAVACVFGVSSKSQPFYSINIRHLRLMLCCSRHCTRLDTSLRDCHAHPSQRNRCMAFNRSETIDQETNLNTPWYPSLSRLHRRNTSI
jgi:hypothetical protein